MGELLVLLCVIGAAWLLLKVIGAVFHVTFAVLALPFQILAAVGVALLVVIFIIPLAAITSVLGILLPPLLLLVPLLPLILIGVGLSLLLRRNQTPRNSQTPAVRNGQTTVHQKTA